MLQSLNLKDTDGNNEELMSDYKNTIKHFQEQGSCEDKDINFMNNIKEQLVQIEKELSFVCATDRPITCTDIKEVLRK